jgi:hypothetical protein
LKLRPFASMTWLLLSLLILWAMSESVSVELHAYDKVKTLGIPQLMILPYRSAMHVTQHYMNLDGKGPIGDNEIASPDNKSSPVPSSPHDRPPEHHATTNAPTDDQSFPSQPTIVLAISMAHEMGIRSWRWYEATIESLAVGVYLYATFVLTSTQFLSGNTGLAFVTIMALCSSAVRILENIFWSPR